MVFPAEMRKVINTGIRDTEDMEPRFMAMERPMGMAKKPTLQLEA